MKIISIDVETTSLDPESGQILEIGAVAWELGKGQIGDPFQCLLKHKQLVGQPYALWLNRDLLKYMVDNPDELVYPYKASIYFRDWRLDLGIKKLFNAAGKNFASFDAGFLKKLDCFYEFNPWRNRILDPSILYVQKGDEALPNTVDCLLRSKCEPPFIEHRAVEDALTVCRLLEEKWAKT